MEAEEPELAELAQLVDLAVSRAVSRASPRARNASTAASREGCAPRLSQAPPAPLSATRLRAPCPTSTVSVLAVSPSRAQALYSREPRPPLRLRPLLPGCTLVSPCAHSSHSAARSNTSGALSNTSSVWRTTPARRDVPERMLPSPHTARPAMRARDPLVPHPPTAPADGGEQRARAATARHVSRRLAMSSSEIVVPAAVADATPAVFRGVVRVSKRQHRLRKLQDRLHRMATLSGDYQQRGREVIEMEAAITVRRLKTADRLVKTTDQADRQMLGELYSSYGAPPSTPIERQRSLHHIHNKLTASRAK
jgi:hypothetical protein